MGDDQQRDTHNKALTINLDPTVYGTIAEIGAGQEVARWFLQAGAASGTVAKTISAYDMTFSDEIYGKVGRYVSRQRVEGMLDHEYVLLRERLAATRAGTAQFFVFADTVSARNYAGTNECHGWLGVRFQATPRGDPNDVILHVNLLDATNLQQQQAVGILGVNLVYAVFHRRGPADRFLPALFDELSSERVEIDLITFRGPEFAGLDDRTATLDLVQGGFAEAVVFTGDGRLVPPSEVIRKRPLVLEPGIFESFEPFHAAMLAAARKRLAAEMGPEERGPLPLFALTGRRPGEPTGASTIELAKRVEPLTRTGSGVLVSQRPEVYNIVRYALRYTSAPIRLVVGALTLADVFHDRHYRQLDGELMEALARLFACNVRMYVHPMPASARDRLDPAVAAWVRPPGGDGLITLEHLDLPRPTAHLFAYLVESGFLVSVPEA
jgi:hypothetical protein